MPESINPYTGQTIQSYKAHTSGEIEDKINLAHNQFLEWRQTNYSHRSQLMNKLAECLEDKKQHLAELATSEMGKPLKEAISEIEKCAWVCRFYAENAESLLSEKEIDTDASESYVSYEPLGCILVVMPWNYPFWQVFRFLAPGLMAGNTGILKHASNVTGCALAIEELVKDAGFPNGCFNTIIADSDQIEKAIKHEHIAAVTLTGSEKAGAAVAANAAGEIKHAVLELGGSNPFIVLDDADLDKAVEDAVFGRFQNNGQSCIAAKRLFVQEGIYDDFLKNFKARVSEMTMGDPMDANTRIGPMAREDLAKEMQEQIEDSVKKGAELVLGGERDKAMFEPTVLTNVSPGMPAFDEELFGPCAAITCVKNLEEAIQLGNQSRFGLGVSIYTSTVENVKKHIPNIEDGAVFINSYVKSDPRLPFGGTKKSGFGRELGEEGIKAFVNIKTVYINN